jgi:hypothetical protein
MTNPEVSQEIHEKFEGSTMSKAGRLAMELAQEKKRLAQELAELQAEAEDLRPTTPTGTPDYYAKWGATVLAILGIFLMQADISYRVSLLFVFNYLMGICWFSVERQGNPVGWCNHCDCHCYESC